MNIFFGGFFLAYFFWGHVLTRQSFLNLVGFSWIFVRHNVELTRGWRPLPPIVGWGGWCGTTTHQKYWVHHWHWILRVIGEFRGGGGVGVGGHTQDVPLLAHFYFIFKQSSGKIYQINLLVPPPFSSMPPPSPRWGRLLDQNKSYVY